MDPIPPNANTVVDFFNKDDGLPYDDPLDHVEITASAGTWNPIPPVPFFNDHPQQLVWSAPARPGRYLLTATYWWSDGHSCHAESFIDVADPPP